MNNKYFLLRSQLTPKEADKFKLYMHSSYFKVGQLIPNLYELIEQNLDSPISKEEIWDKLYKGEKEFAGKQYRKLISDLTRRVEHFLKLENSNSDPVEGKAVLLEVIENKGLESYYDNSYNKYTKFPRHKEKCDSMYFLERYFLELHNYSKRLNDKHRLKSTTSYKPGVYLDMFYDLEKLKAICETKSQANVVEKVNELPNEKALIEKLQGQLYSEYLIFEFYLEVYFLLTKGEVHFEKTKALINQSLEKLRVREKRNLIILIQNFCVRMINTGSSDKRDLFFHEVLNVYKYLLNDPKIKLSRWELKNIVTINLELGFEKEARSLIEDRVPSISPIFQESAFGFNMAHYYYRIGDYTKMRKLLINLILDDEFYAIDGRSMLLKSFWSERDFEGMEPIAERFLKYLKRNKTLARDRKEAHVNRLVLISKFIRIMIGQSGKDKKIINLIGELKKNLNVADRAYLRNKFEGELNIAK